MKYLLSSIALLVVPTAALAQFSELPPPPAYALQNVTLIRPNGQQEAGINIVIRHGMIQAMGQSIDIPADAMLLEGDSLFVYPGIVDPYGEAEVAFPEIERGDSVRSWDAPRDVQGFLAHRRVADHLDQGGAAGKDQRLAGIVAAGVHPDGGLAAGLGAAILLRTDVDRAWELVVNENVGLSMAFQGGQGVYPGTLFGIIAYMRQAFEDAKRDALIRQSYSDDPGRGGIPGFDPDYDVLRRAMAGEFPVFFAANRAEDIRRVLSLADEYGFSPVIVGGNDAWRVADDLASRGVDVILDGDFPEPNDWDPDDEDLEPDAAREKERIENVRSNAARLAAAGVRFALSSGNGDGDIREAARISIEYGLAPDAALQAVTTVPAEMLGIPSVTNVAEGSAATFIATTGRLFDEDTEIAHTFVDGGYEKGNIGGGGGGDAPAVNVTGDWTLTLAAGGMEFEMETTIAMDPDGSYSGNVSNDQFGTAPIRGNVSGNDMSFTITISFGGQDIELSGSGTVEGDRLTGSGDGPFGTFSVSGRKNPGSDK